VTCSKLLWTLTHADSSSILGDTCDNGASRDSNLAKRRSHLAPTSVVPGGNDARPGKIQRNEPQMKKATSLLAAIIVSLATCLGIAVGRPMSDQAYCQALYKALRE
jgi:hypothetical protein